VEELLARLRELFDQRNDLHFELDNALESAIKSKNAAKYNKEKKQNDTSFHAITKAVNKLISELEVSNAGIAKRVSELEGKELDRRATQISSHNAQLALKIDKDSSKASQAAQLASNYSKLESDVNSLLNNILDNL
jgi:hypothetical protein